MAHCIITTASAFDKIFPPLRRRIRYVTLRTASAYRLASESSMHPIEMDLTGIHVLLVDDNEDALEIFGSYLRAGAVVTAARNGAEAWGAEQSELEAP
jgi:hypothetical protein